MTGLLAQTGSFTTTEVDIPESLPILLACAVAVALLIGFVWLVYKRDAARLGWGWRLWLMLLRVGALVGLIAIMLNPHERTQKSSVRPSEVAVLIDTSVSMQFPAQDGDTSNAELTRATAVRHSLFESGVLDELSQRHNVSVFTFDSQLAGPHRVLNRGAAGGVGEESDVASASSAADDTTEQGSTDWAELLRPSGLETRLGESVQELIGRVASPTLSGVIVVTDGSANAGLEASVANQKAQSTQTKLIAVGVGSTQQPTNIAIANVQSPTEVHIGDPFEIGVFVQGQGARDRKVDVELFAKAEGSDSDPTSIGTQTVDLGEDGVPVEVKFREKPSSPGRIEYEIRIRPQGAMVEVSETDNSRRRTINVSEKQIHVLLIAGGPSRDYRFVRNMLFRHTGMELDVWLQTVDASAAVAVSQDATKILTDFPATKKELFDYDVVLAFDIDWARVPTQQLQLMHEWVSEHAGGVVVVAGPIHTDAIASDGLKLVQELLPVRLSQFAIDLDLGSRNTRAWPIEVTDDGREAPFLQLAGSPTDPDTWTEFSGVHRSYPTAGVKDGATALALFTNPRSQTENGKPVLMASQFFGAGRCLFVGTPEMWRLRSVSTGHFNRFWTKAVRDVAQGRIKRGNSRGVLMLDRTEFVLGQSVRLRAQLYDASLNPLEMDAVPVTVLNPYGKPLLPERKLLEDRVRPGQFTGSFRAGSQGTWEVQLPIPESRDVLTRKIEVLLPNLESNEPAQNVKLLERLAADTGGRYLALKDVKDQLTALLPDRSESVMIDERLKPLWDRLWVLLTIVGLLGAEWLTRKLLKLA